MGESASRFPDPSSKPNKEKRRAARAGGKNPANLNLARPNLIGKASRARRKEAVCAEHRGSALSGGRESKKPARVKHRARQGVSEEACDAVTTCQCISLSEM